MNMIMNGKLFLKSIVKNNIESVKQIDQNYTRLLSKYILQFINEYKLVK